MSVFIKWALIWAQNGQYFLKHTEIYNTEKESKTPKPLEGRQETRVFNNLENRGYFLQGITTYDAKYQTSLVYGARGSGKTVFLLEVQRTIDQIPNWHFIRLNNGQGNLLFQLLHGLQKIAGMSITDLIKSIQGLSVMGNSITLKTLEATGQLDYSDLLPTILKRLQERNQSVLIGIDEIEISDDVRAFGSMYQTLIGDDYNISLLMTGLPSRVSEVQNDKTLTFLLRANRIILSPLDEESVRYQYEQTFQRGKRNIDYKVLDYLTGDVKGYAYAFQTLGYYAWRYSQNNLQLDKDVYLATVKSTKQDLFRNAYERMYLDLSRGDLRLVHTIADLVGNEPIAMRTLGEKLQLKANYLSVYRARLLDDQIIKAPQRGYVQFALPFFADFVEYWSQNHIDSF